MQGSNSHLLRLLLWQACSLPLVPPGSTCICKHIYVCMYLKHLNHFAVHWKLTQHCKSTVLQLGKWQHQMKNSMKTPAIPSLHHSAAQPYRDSTSTLCATTIQLEATAALTGRVQLHLHCPAVFMFACLLTCTFLWGAGGVTSAHSCSPQEPGWFSLTHWRLSGAPMRIPFSGCSPEQPHFLCPQSFAPSQYVSHMRMVLSLLRCSHEPGGLRRTETRSARPVTDSSVCSTMVAHSRCSASICWVKDEHMPAGPFSSCLLHASLPALSLILAITSYLESCFSSKPWRCRGLSHSLSSLWRKTKKYV